MVFHKKNVKFFNMFKTWSMKVGKGEVLEYV